MWFTFNSFCYKFAIQEKQISHMKIKKCSSNELHMQKKFKSILGRTPQILMPIPALASSKVFLTPASCLRNTRYRSSKLTQQLFVLMKKQFQTDIIINIGLFLLFVYSLNCLRNHIMASSKRDLKEIKREGDEQTYEDHAPPSKKLKPSEWKK